MQTSDKTESLIPAMLKLHEEMPAIPKKRTAKIGQSHSYSYADISDVLQAIRPKLADCGLVVCQDTKSTDHGLEVTTRLYHSSGEWIEGEPVVMPVGKGTAQDIGAASTYGRRYSLAALLAIATDDDVDGPAAGQNGQQRRGFDPSKATGSKKAPQQQYDLSDWDQFRKAVWESAQGRGWTGEDVKTWITTWQGELELDDPSESTTEQRQHFLAFVKGERDSPLDEADQPDPTDPADQEAQAQETFG